jgi:hypothetical protein
MSLDIRDDRQMRSLTGLTIKQFDILLDAFTKTYEKLAQEEYEQGLIDGRRKRRPGGGRKGALPTMRDKLLFLLYYFKVYPTFDVLGTQFGMARSKANENLYKLLPVLYQALVDLEVMPKRKFSSAAELKETLEGVEKILIDVTERNYRRSQDDEKQREHYSGKKNGIP